MPVLSLASHRQDDLKQLGVASVDLLLIHSPGYGTAPVGQPVGCWGHTPCCTNAAELQATWSGLEAAHAKGACRRAPPGPLEGVYAWSEQHLIPFLKTFFGGGWLLGSWQSLCGDDFGFVDAVPPKL